MSLEAALAVVGYVTLGLALTSFGLYLYEQLAAWRFRRQQRRAEDAEFERKAAEFDKVMSGLRGRK